MTQDQHLTPTIHQGWYEYQERLIEALAPLTPDQLGLRPAPDLLSAGEIAAHIVQTRAAWFYFIMGDGGEEFKTIGKWKVRGEISSNKDEIIQGLETTWTRMQEIIKDWTAEDWGMTWPDEEDESTPDVLTRPWIIWHLIEHDIHHGGEISIILGAHGLGGLKLSG